MEEEIKSINAKKLLIDGINKRTKIKKSDIAEVLRLLPEITTEIFFNLEPKKNQKVSFGFIQMSWFKTSLSYRISFTNTNSHREAARKFKKNHPSNPLVKVFDLLLGNYKPPPKKTA